MHDFEDWHDLDDDPNVNYSAYYAAFRKHQQPPLRLPMFPPMAESVKVEIKPSRAHVEIKELDSNLLSGVRICTLDGVPHHQKEPRPPAWPCVFYTHVDNGNWLEDNTFNLSVESFVKDDEEEKKDKIVVTGPNSKKDKKPKPLKPEEVWFPFVCQDVESCTLIEATLGNRGKKYRKVTQRFTVKLEPPTDDKKAHVPYVQFYCGHEWVRHTGAVFKRGQVITIVIKHPKYPLHWPSPPIITVFPEAEQTFVPMLPKQKLAIVTSKADQYVDFKPHANSAIKTDGVLEEAEFGKQCSYFQCTKPSPASEIIFIGNRKKKKEKKKVVIPYVEKEVRCPIILNPLNDAVIYAQNIDGFIVRFWKDSYHPVSILSGTPIRNVHTAENAQYMERRYDIEKKRPFFYLQKKEHAWVIH